MSVTAAAAIQVLTPLLFRYIQSRETRAKVATALRDGGMVSEDFARRLMDEAVDAALASDPISEAARRAEGQ